MMMKKKIILNEKGKQLLKHVKYVAIIYEDEADGLTKLCKWDTEFVVTPIDKHRFNFVLNGEELNGEVYQA
jgi:hypothetical protein